MAEHVHPLAQKEIAKEEGWNAPRIHALAEAYHTGRLSLVLGAGISKGCGLPEWSELNRTLLRRALEGLYEAVGPDEAPLHARDIEATLKDRVRPMVGRYVKAKLGGSYLDEVRTALYEGPVRLSQTVRWILTLIHALNRHHTHFLQRVVGQCASVSFHRPLVAYGAPKFPFCRIYS